MAIPYEYRDSIRKYLLRESDMYEQEIERLINEAAKINKACRYCNEKPDEVYVASAHNINGSGILARLVRSDKDIYLCLHCGRRWA